MKKIFISYAHFDKETVESVSRYLQDLGYDVWIDTRGLRGGAIWSEEIERGIVNCDVFLLMISPHSMKSRYVRKEIRMAIDKNKYIVTLKIEQAEIPKSLKSPLADIQWVDYEQPDWKSRLLVAFDKNQTDQSEQTRRFEGAMPKTSQVNIPTELRVMISLPDSEGLRKHLPENSEVVSEIIQKDVKGNEIPLRFPVDKDTNSLQDLSLFLSVEAPDFHVETPSLKVFVPPSKDSGVFIFSMLPRKANPRSLVILKLFGDEANSPLIGSLTVTTQIESWQEKIASDTVKVVWRIATLPLKLLTSNKQGEMLAITYSLHLELLPKVISSLSESVHMLKLMRELNGIPGENPGLRRRLDSVLQQLQLFDKQIAASDNLLVHPSIIEMRMLIKEITERLWRLEWLVGYSKQRSNKSVFHSLQEYDLLVTKMDFLSKKLSALDTHE